MISFLPMAHMFERMLQAVSYMTGGKVGFFRGDIRRLPEDIKVVKCFRSLPHFCIFFSQITKKESNSLKELQPTVVPVVPRVLNRLYNKVSLPSPPISISINFR